MIVEPLVAITLQIQTKHRTGGHCVVGVHAYHTSLYSI